eukprot:403374714
MNQQQNPAQITNQEFFTRHMHDFMKFTCQLCGEVVCEKCLVRHQDFRHQQQQMQSRLIDEQQFRDQNIQEYIHALNRNLRLNSNTGLYEISENSDLMTIIERIKSSQNEKFDQVRQSLIKNANLIKDKIDHEMFQILNRIQEDQQIRDSKQAISKNLKEIVQTSDMKEKVKFLKRVDYEIRNNRHRVHDLKKDFYLKVREAKEIFDHGVRQNDQTQNNTNLQTQNQQLNNVLQQNAAAHRQQRNRSPSQNSANQGNQAQGQTQLQNFFRNTQANNQQQDQDNRRIWGQVAQQSLFGALERRGSSNENKLITPQFTQIPQPTRGQRNSNSRQNQRQDGRMPMKRISQSRQAPQTSFKTTKVLNRQIEEEKKQPYQSRTPNVNIKLNPHDLNIETQNRNQPNFRRQNYNQRDQDIDSELSESSGVQSFGKLGKNHQKRQPKANTKVIDKFESNLNSFESGFGSLGSDSKLKNKYDKDQLSPRSTKSKKSSYTVLGEKRRHSRGSRNRQDEQMPYSMIGGRQIKDEYRNYHDAISVSSMSLLTQNPQGNRNQVPDKKRDQKAFDKKEKRRAINESFLAESRISSQSSIQKDEPVTVEEMKNALYYFNTRENFYMTHLDPNEPKVVEIEKFFREDDDITKAQEGFGLINFEIMDHRERQLQMRHLVFGLTQRCNIIQEFHREDNCEYIVYTCPNQKKIQFNTQIVYYQEQLFIIGGDFQGKGNLEPTDYCRKFKLGLNHDTNRVMVNEILDFPNLNRKRNLHNCFILKGYLFVVFGNQDDIEYIDLNDENAQFTRMPLNGYQRLEQAMLFIPPGQDMKVSFFGGNKNLVSRGQAASKTSKLYNLHIEWQQDPENAEKLIPQMGNILESPDHVEFQGKPMFQANIPNKFYYKDQNIWLFLDKDGGLYTYDVTNKSTSYEKLNANQKTQKK